MHVTADAYRLLQIMVSSGEVLLKRNVATSFEEVHPVVKEEQWLDLKQFVDCFVYPQSWKILCEHCLEKYSTTARDAARFRFIEQGELSRQPDDMTMSLDFGCIYLSSEDYTNEIPDEERNEHCSGREPGGIDMMYIGCDIWTRISLYEVIQLSKGTEVFFQLSSNLDLGVLLCVPSAMRIAGTGGLPSSNSTFLISEDIRDQIPINDQGIVTSGVFGCNPRRKERVCDFCGILWFTRMPKCSRCLKVRYCSQLCQRRAWADHKASCKGQT